MAEKKRKISEKENIKKKGYDQARGRNLVNIRAAFQRWRKLKEWEGIESDAKVELILFYRWVLLILLRFTQLICVAYVWICLCVIFTCFRDRCCHGCVAHVGRRFQNKGEVLLGYGRVFYGAFKYQHRLAKITWCTFNYIIYYINIKNF